MEEVRKQFYEPTSALNAAASLERKIVIHQQPWGNELSEF
jgi:hypothetical protein